MSVQKMEKSKQVVCEPTSGLASRIYVLAEAYKLAKDTGHELVIVWQKTSDCDCYYKDVFDTRQFADVPMRVYEYDFFNFKLKDLKGGARATDILRIAKEVLVRAASKMKYTITTKKLKNECSLLKNSYQDGNFLLDPVAAEDKSCYIEAYNCITGIHDLSDIIFKQSYVDRAAQVLNGNEDRCIGVHIRRTDHKPATEESLTSSFVARIRAILEENPGYLFYVSTDDLTEQETLIQQFGEHIIFQKGKVLSRSSQEGMESAVIDMLCLSRTKYILGSYSSIFSRFSAEYGNVELKIM